MKKKLKVGVALAAALTIALTAFAGNEAIAALPIDTAKTDCSITFTVDETAFPDLKDKEIPVSAYRVATVDVSGQFTALEDYKSMQSAFNSISSDPNANDWETWSAEALALVKEKAPTPDGTGENAVDTLKTGLYLVVPGELGVADYNKTETDPYKNGVVLTDTHVYEFTPYLLALPYNDYYNTKPADDTWIYNMTSALKAQQSDRYGDIEIGKTLSTYNASLGDATFVYEITAVKDDETVLSDVRSITIGADSNGAGTVSVKHIPAGAEVTVKEVYTGASYEMTAAPERPATIVADDSVSVSFTNKYNNELNYGSAAVNKFEKLEGEHYKATINGKVIDGNNTEAE